LGVKLIYLNTSLCLHQLPNASIDHAVDFHELSEEKRNAFMRDVARAGNAITQAFSPDKINYGAYGDKISHLHFHVVPKYKDGIGFGGVFEMNPQKVTLSDSEYKMIVEKIRHAL
jgi:diadenosine tetraphosphate (Ap4A) HIT family hydrolase